MLILWFVNYFAPGHIIPPRLFLAISHTLEVNDKGEPLHQFNNILSLWLFVHALFFKTKYLTDPPWIILVIDCSSSSSLWRRPLRKRISIPPSPNQFHTPVDRLILILNSICPHQRCKKYPLCTCIKYPTVIPVQTSESDRKTAIKTTRTANQQSPFLPTRSTNWTKPLFALLRWHTGKQMQTLKLNTVTRRVAGDLGVWRALLLFAYGGDGLLIIIT